MSATGPHFVGRPEAEHEPVSREDVDELIRRFMSQHRPGAIITSWVVCTGSTQWDQEGQALYAFDSFNSADSHPLQDVGLLTMVTRRLRRTLDPGDDNDA